MRFIFRSVLELQRQLQWRNQVRNLVDAVVATLRDRGLDHAVEREKNLRTVINLKELIKAEPSKSLPFSAVVENKDSFRIPIRPSDFLRRYSSIFEQYLPEGSIHPHVRITPEVLYLDSEENLIFQSEAYQLESANRLLKLLMLCRINKIPISIINRLQWDLGLPKDYLQCIVPQFPDYFQLSKVNVLSSSVDALELVCWSEEFSVSFMERRARRSQRRYENGMPIEFPLNFSNGFKMTKEVTKSVENWQRLPYVSPYENASHLPVNGDESDKWAVAVLHELLHLLVSKKTDRENLLCFGDYVGVRSRMKKAFLRHPGIFYISSKNRTHTVVLREAYKRHELVEKHPLMNLRNRFLHLMNMVKDEKCSQHLKKKQGSSYTHDSKQIINDEWDDPGEDNCEEDERDEEDENFSMSEKFKSNVNAVPFLRTAKHRHERKMGKPRILSGERTQRPNPKKRGQNDGIKLLTKGDIRRAARASSRRRFATD